MGCEKAIDATRFPRQGELWGKQVRVCFHYDATKAVLGTVVRDDAEEPCVMIIKLEDGRHVLATECMYQPAGTVSTACA